MHQVHVGPEGTPVSTGDRSLDSAITAALPQVTSFSIGNPPKRFERIGFLESEKNHSDFILKPISGEKQYRVSFRFSRGRLVSQGRLLEEPTSLHDLDLLSVGRRIAADQCRAPRHILSTREPAEGNTAIVLPSRSEADSRLSRMELEGFRTAAWQTRGCRNSLC